MVDLRNEDCYETLCFLENNVLDLIRYLVKTYSNEGDTVFDGYSGSGTTAVACIKEKRNFIGAELNKKYYDWSINRISLMQSKPELELV